VVKLALRPQPRAVLFIGAVLRTKLFLERPTLRLRVTTPLSAENVDGWQANVSIY
jgi:hypothetical protein